MLNVSNDNRPIKLRTLTLGWLIQYSAVYLSRRLNHIWEELLLRQPAGSQVSQRGSIFIGSFRVAMMLIAGTWTPRCRGNGISGQVLCWLELLFLLVLLSGLTFPGFACNIFLREKNYSQGPVSVSVHVSMRVWCVCVWMCSCARPHVRIWNLWSGGQSSYSPVPFLNLLRDSDKHGLAPSFYTSKF